jgi:hypothetical protein
MKHLMVAVSMAIVAMADRAALVEVVLEVEAGVEVASADEEVETNLVDAGDLSRRL